MYFKRLLYFFYFLKKTNYGKFFSDFNYVIKLTGVSRFYLFFDILISSLKYNISIEDYFIFSFFSKTKNERACWAGTGYMYEYQKLMNDKNSVKYLEDKILFLKKYKKFVNRSWFEINNSSDLRNALDFFIENQCHKVVVKYSKGQTGSQVEVIDLPNKNQINYDSMWHYFKSKNYNLIESFVEQHSYLDGISSSGLNTIRVITQTIQGNVVILGVRLRLTVNSPIDNLSAGNFAVALDVDTGKACSTGVYMDIQKSNINTHPVSKFSVNDICIPNWDNLIKFITEVATLDSSLKSVGWDVAILQNGFELIEGNHNWGKTLYQLPINMGCKQILDEYRVMC